MKLGVSSKDLQDLMSRSQGAAAKANPKLGVKLPQEPI
jgi:hypothetical protein